MELKAQFEKAAEESKQLTKKPDNDTLLKLYSLYKQGMEGDINEPPPENPFDFKAKFKYNAWLELKGKSQDDAMTEYVALVEKLKSEG